jgi:hypothetical protein
MTAQEVGTHPLQPRFQLLLPPCCSRLGRLGAWESIDIMRPDPQIIVPLFIATWIVLGIFSLWLMYFDTNVARKKRLLPIFVVGSGLLFIIFSYLMTGAQPRMLLFLCPPVTLIIFLNLRGIKICSACGRTIHSGVWLSKAEFCPKCGARLA